MLKNLIPWIVAFVVSLIAGLLLNMDQGATFFVVYLIASGVMIVIILATTLAASGMVNNMGGAGVLSLYNVGITILLILAALAVAWLGAWFFKIDYYVAYQLVTLGQCLMWRIKLPSGNMGQSTPRPKSKTMPQIQADQAAKTE